MTPGFQMSEMKVIYGDGILGEEKLLQQLDIQDTCCIVLDHQHLLSSDFGAWPKRFGGPVWATELKHYCHTIWTRTKFVWSEFEKWSSIIMNGAIYVERNIHLKRHLFANHLIQHYPLNLNRQGIAPAEANHSSALPG
jgi:hypothetical protein